MNKIAIITARSGSKGLKNKNVLLAEGKPLIAYTIEAAINSKEFCKIIVSTDSQEYIDLLSKYPIDFIKRAEHLSTDRASSFVVIEDVLEKYSHISYDYFVLLQPTSPLRTLEHIKEANQKFEENFDKFDFLVSVSESHKPTSLTRIIDEDESLKNFQLDYSNYARQQYHPEYSPNGAIFSAKPKEYLTQKHFYGQKSMAYFMNRESSIDIDEYLDFEYFCFLMKKYKKDNQVFEHLKEKINYKLLSSKSGEEQISFIGHSILEQWGIKEINGLKVNNLSLSSITTSEYNDFILEENLSKAFGKAMFLMVGANDILNNNSYPNPLILLNIKKLINKIRSYTPNIEIYFLEILPTALRIDINNTRVCELNSYLKDNLSHHAIWVDTYDYFCDKYQKLDINYTTDGIHLNEYGYLILEKIISGKLRNN